ncbi:MAG TPA: hypothetical protein V6D11_29375 [Waterburya sp.]
MAKHRDYWNFRQFLGSAIAQGAAPKAIARTTNYRSFRVSEVHIFAGVHRRAPLVVSFIKLQIAVSRGFQLIVSWTFPRITLQS